MNTDFTPKVFDYDSSQVFDWSFCLYYRQDLAERYDYLIESAKALTESQEIQAWLDAHKQEFNILQHLLYKVPLINQ